MANLNKKLAQEKIDTFFEKESFTSDEMKKIRTLAMKFKIKLGKKRSMFCKKCLSPLQGKIRVSKTHKTITCSNCGAVNRFKI